MPDRNKTELTQNITRLAALWLDERGFKPVETEVGVARGWVADLAGVCCPTQTELIKLKLLRPAPRCDYRTEESRQRFEAWKVERDALQTVLTATVEVKTSVGDYRGDPKWVRDWPTDLCWVAMPEGMIPAEQWPKDWGVLLFSQQGTTLRKHVPVKRRLVTFEQQRDVILNIAVRRDHATRYERLRKLQQQIRIREGESKSILRFSNAVRVVKQVLSGERTLEEALTWSGQRRELPDHILRDLRELRAKYGVPAPGENTDHSDPRLAHHVMPAVFASDPVDQTAGCV